MAWETEVGAGVGISVMSCILHTKWRASGEVTVADKSHGEQVSYSTLNVRSEPKLVVTSVPHGLLTERTVVWLGRGQ